MENEEKSEIAGKIQKPTESRDPCERNLRRRPRRRASILEASDLGFNLWVQENERLKDIESGRIPGPHGGPC
jgi:hypothetical protein